MNSRLTFDDSYFQEEVRLDFTITSMMKRAWAAMQEVLLVIDAVCKNNNIKYSVGYGTLLGAIRHKGFIPWDDDIDIMMTRDEYDRFIKLAPNALPNGFVLAGMYANSERLQEACFVPHSRVIADETQWNFNDYMRYFHGFPYQRIGIDIFPMDTISSNTTLYNLQKECYLSGLTLMTNWEAIESAHKTEDHLRFIEKISGVTIPRNAATKNFIWRFLDATISLAHTENTSKCSNMSSYV